MKITESNLKSLISKKKTLQSNLILFLKGAFMFKKMCLSLALMCGMAVADVGPINPEFKSLLRNDDVMEKNTLKLKTIFNGDSEQYIETTGEVVATGVLVSSSNGTYFYPDTNLKNVFFDRKQVFQCASEKAMSACLAMKPSKSEGIKVSNDVVAKTFGGKIYGEQAVRVKAHMSQNGSTMKSVFALTPPKKSYSAYPIKGAVTKEFGYASKDDYVNIRQTPKGTIAGQMLKADMQKPKDSKAILIGASCYEDEDPDGTYVLCNDVNGWYEVFYFPPGIRHGKDAIHGYIHKSQIRGY